MGVNHEELQASAREHSLLHFTRNGSALAADHELLVLERGEGPYVFDTRGRRYIDALSSLFCAQLGYSYGAEMAEVATAQLERLAFNTNWATAHPASIELAERLAEIMPGRLSRAFFTSGGSESVEAAWKIIREHHLGRGEPQRTKAVARDIAYHGVTLGALALTGVGPMKQDFGNPRSRWSGSRPPMPFVLRTAMTPMRSVRACWRRHERPLSSPAPRRSPR